MKNNFVKILTGCVLSTALVFGFWAGSAGAQSQTYTTAYRVVPLGALNCIDGLFEVDGNITLKTCNRSNIVITGRAAPAVEIIPGFVSGLTAACIPGDLYNRSAIIAGGAQRPLRDTVLRFASDLVNAGDRFSAVGSGTSDGLILDLNGHGTCCMEENGSGGLQWTSWDSIPGRCGSAPEMALVKSVLINLGSN